MEFCSTLIYAIFGIPPEHIRKEFGMSQTWAEIIGPVASAAVAFVLWYIHNHGKQHQ